MTQAMVESDLVELIGPIYDTVVDPARWPDVLERLRQRFHFHNAMMAVNALPRGETVTQAMAGISPEFAAIAQEYGHHILDAWGGAEKVARVPLDEPVVQTEMAEGTDYQNNPYYLHFVRPQGINNAVAIKLADDRLAIGSLAFGRHESAHPVTAGELAGLRFLAPHLRRAVTISRLLETTVNAAVTFEAALEASPRAVIIVEADLSVAFANGAAEALLEDADVLGRMRGKLVVRGELVPGQLQAAIAAAADHEDQLGRSGTALPITRNDGMSLLLHVLPLRKRTVRTDYGRRAVAAIFISEPGRALSLPADALSLIHGLTPAETRVLELIVEGKTTRETARQLSIAPSTVRSQLLSVFAKTGRHSRIELVRLFQEGWASP